MSTQAVDGYGQFLEDRVHIKTMDGFDPVFMPGFLFDFQSNLVEWAVSQGRAAIFADCGLGKTPMQLVWAENVVRHTNKPVLLLTPLAVSSQTIREAGKFDIEAARSRDGKPAANITVTNYERLHLFDPADFSGVVCDESSILKSFDGAYRQAITEFMRKLRFRLLCTATAAPNDYTELGTSSEALGFLGYMDMLNRFFKNDQNTSGTGRFHGKSVKWRLKGHAEDPFWRWVCSWARAMRKPSDFGFSDKGFDLPALNERQHVVQSNKLPEGWLFPVPAVGLKEQREEQARTVEERCDMVAELVAHDRPALVWCHRNREADLIEKLVPDAMQVAGSDSDDAKEERLTAFAEGQLRVLVTKPQIGAWGLNFQHCSHVTYFPSHSYEQYYQAIRRCWRFGQQNPVTVDIVTTEGGTDVLNNLQRKAHAADRMFERLVQHMRDHLTIRNTRTFSKQTEVPSWL